MPEGDTTYKIAAELKKELVGQTLTRVDLRGVYQASRLAGSTVVEVQAHGKHLLVDLDASKTIRVHLGMRGKWHRYSPDQKWKRSRSTAAVVLETGERSLVCFNPSEVELFATQKKRWHPQLSRLGPDLLGSDPDFWEIVARARRFGPGERPLAEVLLDQKVACGLGNVYKSEVPFMGAIGESFGPAEQGLSPWIPLSWVKNDQLIELYQRGRQLLLANVGGWMRTTRVDRRRRPAPRIRLWVYGRGGETCLRCGAVVESRHQGLANRATFWCSGCQTERKPPNSPGSGG